MSLKEHINNVKTFFTKAGQDIPEKISEMSEDARKLRAKLILEEALELISKGLAVDVCMRGQDYPVEMEHLTFSISTDRSYDLVQLADGAADLCWVGVTGVAVAAGFDFEPILTEVDRSNMSKFIDGYRDPNSGKWIKGPSYSPADIEGNLRNIDGSCNQTILV